MANLANIAINPFSWGDIALSESVSISGVPHATKRAIGEFLEYSDPRKRINNLLDRNSYIEEFSVDLNLRSTDGKNYDTKVYHPMGFLLIVMESDQPKARLAKVAVAHFVWHFTHARELSVKEVNEVLREINRIEAAITQVPTAYQFQSLFRQLQFHYARLGWPMPDINGLFKGLRFPELIETNIRGLLGLDGEV